MLVVDASYRVGERLMEVPALLYASATSKPLVYPMSRATLGDLWDGIRLRGVTITSQHPADPIAHLAAKMNMPKEAVNHIFATMEHEGGGSRGSHDGLARWRERYLNEGAVPLGTTACQNCNSTIPLTWKALESNAIDYHHASCAAVGRECLPSAPPPAGLRVLQQGPPPGITAPNQAVPPEAQAPLPPQRTKGPPRQPLQHFLLSPSCSHATGANAVPLGNAVSWDLQDSSSDTANALPRAPAQASCESDAQPLLQQIQALTKCVGDLQLRLSGSKTGKKKHRVPGRKEKRGGSRHAASSDSSSSESSESGGEEELQQPSPKLTLQWLKVGEPIYESVGRSKKGHSSGIAWGNAGLHTHPSRIGPGGLMESFSTPPPKHRELVDLQQLQSSRQGNEMMATMTKAVTAKTVLRFKGNNSSKEFKDWKDALAHFFSLNGISNTAARSWLSLTTMDGKAKQWWMAQQTLRPRLVVSFEQLMEWVRFELVPTAEPAESMKKWVSLVYRGDLEEYFKEIEELDMYHPQPPEVSQLLAARPFGQGLVDQLQAINAAQNYIGLNPGQWQDTVRAFVHEEEQKSTFRSWSNMNNNPSHQSSMRLRQATTTATVREEQGWMGNGGMTDEEAMMLVSQGENAPPAGYTDEGWTAQLNFGMAVQGDRPARIGKGPRPCFCCGEDSHSWIHCDKKKRGNCAVCGALDHRTRQCFHRFQPHPNLQSTPPPTGRDPQAPRPIYNSTNLSRPMPTRPNASPPPQLRPLSNVPMQAAPSYLKPPPSAIANPSTSTKIATTVRGQAARLEAVPIKDEDDNF